MVDKHKEDRITKALILCSYNDYGSEAEFHSIEQANNERERGHKFINHLILRDKTREIDNVKFNFLLDGAPIMVYSLLNVFRSRVKDAIIVGNKDSEQIFNYFMEYYRPHKYGKNFKFVNEGKNLSLSNTIKKGRDNLNLNSNELTLLLPADIPFFSDLYPIIKDGTNNEYEGILNLNSKEKIGKYFPRNYHLDVKKEDKIYRIKEPNLFLFNLSKLNLNIIDMAYGGRKTYSSFKDTGKRLIEKGRDFFIKERFIKKGKIIKTFCALRGSYGSIVSRLLQNKDPLIKLNSLEKLVNIAFDMRIKIKIDNSDPSTLEDIDSLEDWCYLNSMILNTKKNGGDPTSIYPYYNDLHGFKKGVMPLLQKKIDLYNDYPKYMNDLFDSFGLTLNKNIKYYNDGSPFLKNEPYKEGNLSINFSKKFVEKMINNNIKYHKRYMLNKN